MISVLCSNVQEMEAGYWVMGLPKFFLLCCFWT